MVWNARGTEAIFDACVEAARHFRRIVLASRQQLGSEAIPDAVLWALRQILRQRGGPDAVFGAWRHKLRSEAVPDAFSGRNEAARHFRMHF